MMTLKFRKLAVIILTIALTSILCFCLFTHNNKYTYNDHQPVNGHISYSEDSFDIIHYLINDWEFYPDMLLTPDQLSDPAVQNQMVYTSIGERTVFDGLGTREIPYGSGTYAMNISLACEPRSYTMEIPEIFSSYRIYINGEEYRAIGNPDPERYEAHTQTRLITFRAENSAHIVIAVSNYSHFYSGMISPPCFGAPEHITTLREIRQNITLFVVTLELLLVFITFYLGVSMKRANALLFSMLSLSSSLTVLFPLIHELYVLPLHPWHLIETTCTYLAPVLILILHNRICEIERRTQMISFCISMFIYALAIGVALNADSLTVPVIQVFSACTKLYKYSIAFYILITSYWAVRSEIEMSKPLFYASIAYATVFLWDRIFPAFEPIFFGRYTDWANLILIASIGFSLLDNLSTSYKRNLAFAEEHRQMTKQLTMQQEYSKLLSEQSERNRRMIHDFRHHLNTISALTEQLHTSEDFEQSHKELKSYLNSISEQTFSSPNTTVKPFSSNHTVDALLQYYHTRAIQNQISTEFHLITADLPMSDVEFCTMLGNLLENAVDACLKLPNGKLRRIQINSKETEHQLFLRIDNTYDGFVLMDNEIFLTRKIEKALHGIGMQSVREIVERYGGTIDIYPKKNLFCVGISLPLTRP